MFHARKHKYKHPASPDEDYICDHSGCREKGQYPAPKSRDNLQDYFFFCLDHVRQYNKNWNYYEGMNAAQIEAERDADIIGHRPTLPPFSTLPPFCTEPSPPSPPDPPDPYRTYDSKTRAALQLLQVTPPVNWQSIKTAYKFLAKQFHPDSTTAAKDRHTQDKMKSINQAYATLKLAFSEKID